MKSTLIWKNYEVNKEKMNLWGEFCIMENDILQLDEKFADDFAINFINENLSNLWRIVDENTSEEEIEFYLE